MSKFIMMCGLPSSGKTTLANKLFNEENAVILSSDELRIELFNNVNDQKNNSTLFKEMNLRANKLLQQNKNVIYDATNINRKRRKHLINNVIKANNKTVYYLNNYISTIVIRDMDRTKSVGSDVIYKMYKTLHIPVENEGWDEVIYTGNKNKYFQMYKRDYEQILLRGCNHDDLFRILSSCIPEFEDIKNLPQDSIYHSFSVSRHTYYVYKYILDNYKESDKLVILWAALFHDIGKAFCKSFINFKGEETKYAHFICHENVSSQLAAVYLDLLGYDTEFVKQVVALVQFHMIIMNANKKTMKNVNDLLGDELFNKLLFLHIADLEAK